MPRRRRGRAEEEEGGEGEEGHVNGVAPVQEKRGRGRKREVEDAPAAMAPPPVPKRVRRATTKAQLAAGEHADYEPHTSVFPAAPEVVQSVETPKRGQRIVTLKTKAGSFGALAARGAERGLSSESAGSEGWRAEGEWEEGKGKRARKVTKKVRESGGVEGVLLLPAQDAADEEDKGVRKPRIKVVKSGTAAAAGAAPADGGPVGAVSPAANGASPAGTPGKARKTVAQKAKRVEEGQGELSAQEYAALSKSEKMSHSMKSEYPTVPHPITHPFFPFHSVQPGNEKANSVKRPLGEWIDAAGRRQAQGHARQEEGCKGGGPAGGGVARGERRGGAGGQRRCGGAGGGEERCFLGCLRREVPATVLHRKSPGEEGKHMERNGGDIAWLGSSIIRWFKLRVV